MKRTQTSGMPLESPSPIKKPRVSPSDLNDLATSTSRKLNISTPKTTPKNKSASQAIAPTMNKYLSKGTPSSQKVPAVSDVIDLTGLSDSDDEIPQPKNNTRRKQAMAIDMTKPAQPPQATRPNTVRGSKAGPLSRRKEPHPAKDGRPLDEENSTAVVVDSTSRRTRTAVQPIAGPSHRTRRASDIIMTDAAPGDDTEAEVLETENLKVYGEDSDSEDDGDDDDEVPMRVLRDFRIFKQNTPKEPVPFDQLVDEPEEELAQYSATGLVEACVDEDSDEEGSDSADSESMHEAPQTQRIRLSDILEVDVHHCFTKSFAEPERPVEYRYNENIYLLTKHAWYKLDSPAASYRKHFQEFARQHRILHTLLREAQKEARLTLEGFKTLLDEIEDDGDAPQVSSEDLDDPVIVAHFQKFLTKCARGLRVQRVPVIKKLLEQAPAPMVPTVPAEAASKTYAPASATKKTKVAPSASQPVARRRTVSASESPEPPDSDDSAPNVRKKGKPARMTDIHVEPIVKRVAQEYIDREISVTEHTASNIEQKDKHDATQYPIHNTDPHEIKNGRLLMTDERGRRFFQSIYMDRARYSVGDCVAIAPGADEDKVREQNAASIASQSPNRLANDSWFGIIRAIRKDEPGGEYQVHVQWFTHGSKMILQELAHSRGLFLLEHCDDILAPTIKQKVEVDFGARGEERADDKAPDGQHYHCAHVFDPEKTSFTTAPSEKDLAQLYEAYPAGMRCPSCCLKERDTERETLKSDGATYFSHYDEDYHVGDTVYLAPVRQYDNFYRIGLITAIRGKGQTLSVSLQIFARHCQQTQLPSHISASGLQNDNRCLIIGDRDDEVVIATIGQKTLVVHGKCYVKVLHTQSAVDEWVEEDDHFYVGYRLRNGKLVRLGPSQFHACAECMKLREDDLADIRRLQDRHGVNGKLRGLELFAGGGGLGKGMEMSGFVDTALAVDYEPAAVDTYKKNHPYTTVLCADSNKVLKAVRGDKSVKDEYNQPFPPLPKPCTADKSSSIDFVFGGPPCQSFSKANHYKDPNDIRSFLPLNMLSFVEAYKPDYFLLENVRGLLDFRLGTTTRGMQDANECIKNSMVKIILRTLIALGYQASVRVLQAGQFGVPQARERVIFLGAKLGLPMPVHPVPTHAFPKVPNTANLADGTTLVPLPRAPNGEKGYIYAPLPPVTIEDAIGDLPPFDWVNPHEIFPSSTKDRNECKAREDAGIKQLVATPTSTGLVGFPRPSEYHCPPQNRYQLQMRRNSPGGVLNMYTRTYRSSLVERVVTVPLEPDADFRRLPEILQPGGQREKRRGSFGRCGLKGFFATVMTQPNPSSKGTWLLHPTQKRTYTVRECARSQSFPDDFEFDSKHSKNPETAVNDFCRIGGNAVPIELAKKLGQSIGAALVKRWREEERQGSPEL
ncbi:S-adenosyl-L-methionine-dependent methyltransferase [Schizophyllum commune H4-8]|uniref:Cytosine-specific methyltransferase n=1 Tax=Schizophyllum commune (strain H4-8 / FGSC 9210) TaxID=578458 RepID=D8PV89_SCHCM|nr:S-adenosyl-L-methionine-dependent methyltransferase [Schizophyllum commune H4-8]KAI5900451.1 S-adenosyl-L-methionine-dependent methyltransferase [Schizophyllum commune H4-8]